jgi:hypothetical protein
MNNASPASRLFSFFPLALIFLWSTVVLQLWTVNILGRWTHADGDHGMRVAHSVLRGKEPCSAELPG